MVFTGVGLLQFELKFLWDMYMLVTGNFCVGGSLLQFSNGFLHYFNRNYIWGLITHIFFSFCNLLFGIENLYLFIKPCNKWSQVFRVVFFRDSLVLVVFQKGKHRQTFYYSWQLCHWKDPEPERERIQEEFSLRMLSVLRVTFVWQ